MAAKSELTRFDLVQRWNAERGKARLVAQFSNFPMAL